MGKNEDEFDKIPNEIANLYLQRYPRVDYYEVSFIVSELQTDYSACLKLNSDEIEIIRRCKVIMAKQKCTLQEVLEWEECEDDEDGFNIGVANAEKKKLLDRLILWVPWTERELIDVDVETPIKISSFCIWKQNEDKRTMLGEYVDLILTDDEFKTLLVEHLKSSNKYSFNMLVYNQPDLAQKLMWNMSYASMDYEIENVNPFICEMTDIRKVAESILNPSVDALGLFESSDEDLKEFARKHQIVPSKA